MVWCYQTGAGTIILDWNETEEIFMGGGIIFPNPDAEADTYTFFLIYLVIHALRQIPGPWECKPPPP